MAIKLTINGKSEYGRGNKVAIAVFSLAFFVLHFSLNFFINSVRAEFKALFFERLTRLMPSLFAFCIAKVFMSRKIIQAERNIE